MQSRKRNHICGQFAEVGVELAGEAEAGREARHPQRDDVVQVAVRRRVQLERLGADVVQRFVVDDERLVRRVDEQVHGQRGVVRLDNSVRHLYSMQCEYIDKCGKLLQRNTWNGLG